MRQYISEEFKKVDGKISIHDLRIVRGIERDIALFDIVSFLSENNINDKSKQEV